MVTQVEASRALVAFDYETITVSSSGVGLTASKIQPASGWGGPRSAIAWTGATLWQEALVIWATILPLYRHR